MLIHRRLFVLGLLALPVVTTSAQADDPAEIRFQVSFSQKLSEQPIDGRIILIFSTNAEIEPRNQVVDGAKTRQAFGIEGDTLKPGQEAVIDGEVLGYPLESLRNVPTGTYRVQAVLQRYETVHRPDGHTLKVPMGHGEGHQWNLTPGNFYSTPKPVTINPEQGGLVRIEMDQIILEIPPPPTTKYINARASAERTPLQVLGPPDGARGPRRPA